MIKVEEIDTWGFKHAIRGMRNPMESWQRSDSGWEWVEDPSPINPNDPGMQFVVGQNDLDLMKKLFKAGSEHRKYARQIFVSMDITAPLYWWKEFDTYKVGTVSDSCSTMHKIHSKEFTIDDMSTDNLLPSSKKDIQHLVDRLNFWRLVYLNGGSSDDEDPTGEKRLLFEPKDKIIWWQLIQLLPSSYNQKRTITFSYENVFNILRQRSGHKLDEWREFCDILRTLPYVQEIMEDEDGNS